MKPRSRRWASHCSLRNSAAPEARCCFPRPKYLISGGSRIAAPMPSPFWHPAFINCNYQPGQRSLQEPCQEHNFRAYRTYSAYIIHMFFSEWSFPRSFLLFVHPSLIRSRVPRAINCKLQIHATHATFENVGHFRKESQQSTSEVRDSGFGLNV